MWGLSASELAAGIRARRFSAREVMESHLGRIEAVNPRLNAIVTLDAEGALAAAGAADRRPAAGPLHGVPVAVKDLEDTAGMRTTYGSRLFASHVPAADSVLVERWRRAGAIVIGKTNTPEFGAGSQTFNEVFGVTRNPYGTAYTPGGSSGGAAVAVASGMVPLADGSDLGASIRNPSAFCNLVGLRPSPGRVADAGPGDAWNPFGVLGALALTAEDALLALSVLAGPDPRDPLALPEAFGGTLDGDVRGLRIAWSRTLGGLPVEPEITAVLDAQRATFEELGCVVEDVEPDLAAADEAFDTLRALAFAGAFGEIADRVKPDIAENARRGLALSAAQIARALALRGELFTRMRGLLERYDFLAGPVTQVAPFEVETPWPRTVAGVEMTTYTDWFRSCSRITVTAHPAVSVPAGFTGRGLPVGLQLVGRYRGELGLLRMAAALEAATGLGRRRPQL
ncbi:amidase [Candidatus Solirubrobacter pratensis]|uniref:amidase n=1 Tax=Candidatus Solirubrobacter pratensis TaxID=1298857 RepID=UPI0004045665|nr:amidase family protein [Candidatus Solirubrobacter pratensis]